MIALKTPPTTLDYYDVCLGTFEEKPMYAKMSLVVYPFSRWYVCIIPFSFQNAKVIPWGLFCFQALWKRFSEELCTEMIIVVFLKRINGSMFHPCLWSLPNRQCSQSAKRGYWRRTCIFTNTHAILNPTANMCNGTSWPFKTVLWFSRVSGG